MKTLNISDARNHLPTVVAHALRDQEAVVLIRYGKPMATITPFRKVRHQNRPYPLRGHPIVAADDFDAPAPDLWDALTLAEPRGKYVTAGTSKKRRSARLSGLKK